MFVRLLLLFHPHRLVGALSFILNVNMHAIIMASCDICTRKVLRHSNQLKCSICKNILHLNCISGLTKKDNIFVDRSTMTDWICPTCVSVIFPYNHFTENDDFLNALADDWRSDLCIPYHFIQNDDRVFQPFELNVDTNTPLSDIDPDLQYYQNQYPSNIPCDYYLEDHFNKRTFNLEIDNKSFSLIHSNIRSIPKNLQNFESYLSNLNHDFSIIALSETWLKDHTVDLYNMKGYSSEHKYRKSRSGGGVSLYIMDSIEYCVREDLSIQNQYIESLFIEIGKDGINKTKNVIVGVIYRPPDTDLRIFNEHIQELLSSIKSENKFTYCLGDFNINLLNIETHTESHDFTDTMFSFSLIPAITNVVNGRPHIMKSRVYNDENREKFGQIMINEDWTDVLQNKNPQEACTLFYNKFSKTYNDCFPIKSIKSGYKNRKPWLSDALKKSIKKKNKLFRRKNKTKNLEHEAHYKKYRNCLNKTLHNAEREYLEKILKENQSNLKNTWRILKNVINKKSSKSSCSKILINNQITTDTKKISDAFNSFFINIGPSLAEKIEPMNDPPSTFMQKQNPETMILEPVIMHEVKTIISRLKDGSSGWDQISSRVVKSTYESFLMPLTHIMNISILHGVFPSEMKIARVIPIFKAGDSMLMSNYRPVSVLPIFSKILERLMYTRLLKFINEHRLLYKFQFGFRESHSPNLAIIYLVDKISNALEEGDYVLGLFLDFSKAFDTVNHDILFDKLEIYGIRGTALDWFKSYFDSRKQYVVFDGVESSSRYITCGVPQGSILGPLLFLLYINDLSSVSDKLFSLLFADDSNMFLSGKDPNSLIETMNSEMEKVTKWLKVNKLSLNLKKNSLYSIQKEKEESFAE